MRMTDRIQKCDIHLNPVKSLVQHHQTRMAHDAQLSNGPIGASIRDPSPRSAHSTFNIQQCQLLQSHSTQHTALEFGLSQ